MHESFLGLRGRSYHVTTVDSPIVPSQNLHLSTLSQSNYVSQHRFDTDTVMTHFAHGREKVVEQRCKDGAGSRDAAVMVQARCRNGTGEMATARILEHRLFVGVDLCQSENGDCA